LIATGLHRADPKTLLPILAGLRKATHEKNRVSVIYQSGSQTKAQKRRIDPYALVLRTGLWYLVGYCHLRTAIRTFRVDRIQKLSILDQTFQRSQDFNIHNYLENEFREQPSVRARLKFVPEAAHIVMSNRIIWESIEENPDGSTVVTLAAPDLPWLASVTLSFANWVTVIEPCELREMVRTWAEATANLYQK
jgi:predicted DNA-binding transcriptional regulator YafY